jgi:P27 family predicted phage terminase small subunit
MAGAKGRSGGHNRKSVAQLKLEGTYRADRHGGRDGVVAPKGRPTPPASLAGVALAEWTRMCDRLEQAGTLSTIDDGILLVYVRLFADVEAIADDHERTEQLAARLKAAAVRKLAGAELVAAMEKIVELEHLREKQRTKLRQGRMAVKQLLVEFGMTPASRHRVQPIADEPKPEAPATQVARLQQKVRLLKFGDVPRGARS